MQKIFYYTENVCKHDSKSYSKALLQCYKHPDKLGFFETTANSISVPRATMRTRYVGFITLLAVISRHCCGAVVAVVAIVAFDAVDVVVAVVVADVAVIVSLVVWFIIWSGQYNGGRAWKLDVLWPHDAIRWLKWAEWLGKFNA